MEAYSLSHRSPPPRVIAYHKPVGEVVTHDDPQNRPTVFRKLPRLQHGKWQSVGNSTSTQKGCFVYQLWRVGKQADASALWSGT